jgi:hypothetical protein
MPEEPLNRINSKTNRKRKKALRLGRRRCDGCGPTWDPTYSFWAFGKPSQTHLHPLDLRTCLNAFGMGTALISMPDSTNYWCVPHVVEKFFYLVA